MSIENGCGSSSHPTAVPIFEFTTKSEMFLSLDHIALAHTVWSVYNICNCSKRHVFSKTHYALLIILLLFIWLLMLTYCLIVIHNALVWIVSVATHLDLLTH